jgi:hypothetical protein
MTWPQHTTTQSPINSDQGFLLLSQLILVCQPPSTSEAAIFQDTVLMLECPGMTFQVLALYILLLGIRLGLAFDIFC